MIELNQKIFHNGRTWTVVQLNQFEVYLETGCGLITQSMGIDTVEEIVLKERNKIIKKYKSKYGNLV